MAICFVCGKLLIQAVTNKPVEGITHHLNDSPVRMHKCCEQSYLETFGAKPTAKINDGSFSSLTKCNIDQ